MKLLVTCPPMINQISRYSHRIQELGFDIHCPDTIQTLPEEELIKIVNIN